MEGIGAVANTADLLLPPAELPETYCLQTDLQTAQDCGERVGKEEGFRVCTI